MPSSIRHRALAFGRISAVSLVETSTKIRPSACPPVCHIDLDCTGRVGPCRDECTIAVLLAVATHHPVIGCDDNVVCVAQFNGVVVGLSERHKVEIVASDVLGM